MSKTVALLRGINVGGKRVILMSDLQQLFLDLGYIDVKTYIQSGNVIFNQTAVNPNNQISEQLEKAIAEKFGFDVPVVIRSYGDLKSAITNNPFLDKQPLEQLHLTFLSDCPSTDEVNKIKASNLGSDQFECIKNDVFLHCSGKYHESKLSNQFFESKLKCTATTRNWKTVLKLVDLSA
jgi:uncharacterized protein (DUF1697 family)